MLVLNRFLCICSAAMEAVGLRLLDPSSLHEAFTKAGMLPVAGYARIDVQRFTQVNTAKGPWPFVEDLLMTAAEETSSPEPEEQLSSKVAVEQPIPAPTPASNTTPAMALESIQQSVHAVAQEILGDCELPGDGQFPAGSFDSLSAVELSSKLGEVMGITLPGTLVFDHPSVASIVELVHSKLKPAPAAPDAAAIAPVAELRTPSAPVHSLEASAMRPHPLIRVAATASRRPPGPARATAPEHALDAISTVPYSRWDVEAGQAGSKAQPRVRFAAWLEGVAMFDPAVFQLTGNEAEVMDPQQRLLLEVSWEALQVVGRDHCAGETGVFVGIQQMEYGGMAAQHLPIMGAYSATSSAFSVAAGRVSFTYGFSGPAVSIDTACSSAMVAAHSAAQHLEKRPGVALSASINLMLSERTTAAAQIAGMLTPNGRCKTLDAAADGYVRGEVCVVSVFDAFVSGEEFSQGMNAIVLRSTYVNQDGRSSSLTAPNGPAQQRVLRGALETAAARPSDLSGLEVHGTGTALGDPIELGAATAVLPGCGGMPLRLTAAKSRVGHAEPAAGAVGMLQAMGQLQQNSSRAITHLTRMNNYITGIYSELQAAGAQVPWAPRQDGLAVLRTQGHWEQAIGVSSFAFQGTNAHIILGALGEAVSQADCAGLSQPRGLAWDRKRYWYCLPAAHLLDVARFSGKSHQGTLIFHTSLNKPALAYLIDHWVQDRALFPAAAMLETLFAAGRAAAAADGEGAPSLQGATIATPLVLQTGAAAALQCLVDQRSGAMSLETQRGMAKVLHMAVAATPELSVNGRQKASKSLQQRLYEAFLAEASKVVLTALPELVEAAREACARDVSAVGTVLANDGNGSTNQDGYAGVHPAILDATTHLAAALQAEKQEEQGLTRVPVGMGAFYAASARTASHAVPCSGTFEGIQADDVAVSTFRSAEQPGSFKLAGFQARTMRRGVTGATPRSTAQPTSIARTAVHSGGKVRATKEPTAVTVQKLASKLLGVEVEADQPLMEAGMDSLTAVELRTALINAFKVDLPSTVTFDYPTVASLARCISAEVESTGADAEEDIEADGDPVTERVHTAIDVVDIERKVAGAVRRLLGADVASDQPLMEAGLDSLGAVELRTALNDAFSTQLPATATFDYSNVAALAGFIATHLEENPPEVLTPAEEVVEPSVAASLPPASPEAVAIMPLAAPALASAFASHMPTTSAVVAASARYPTLPWEGPALGLPAFAHGMRTSADLPRRIPLQRWDIDQLYSPDASSGSNMYVRLGMFLPSVQDFDPGAFRLSAGEAAAMDPQQRLLLMETACALEESREALGPLGDTKTGVYVGCMYQEFTQLQFTLGMKINPGVVTGNGISYLVGRVSYTFGLAGPCVSTDTACSSSLVAAHQAHKGLLAGETVAAVAGGVNAMLLPITTASICGMSALSPVARCKTFDASADGYGRGEGFAVLILAPGAVPQGALAVVHGTGINQDGRSSGLTAPNGPSQTNLVRDVMTSGALAPENLVYLALHGTGTPLGDPIEVNALGNAVRPARGTQRPPLALGSVKSCYGHTEGAAGLTGALLALHGLGHREDPAIMHLRNVNPYVASALAEWKKRGIDAAAERQLGALPAGRAAAFAGTSSFGMGGTNAHLALSVPKAKAYGVKAPLAFQTAAYWPAPVASHLLLTGVGIAGSTSALISIDLLKPVLGYMFDHRVHGNVLLPGAALLEASNSAARVLDRAHAATPALVECTILAPVPLSGQVEAMQLEVEVALSTGKLEIRNAASRGVHFTGKAAQAPNWDAVLQHDGPVAQRSWLYAAFFAEERQQSGFPGSIGTISVSATAADGYCMPPAAIDSCLHIAAAMADPGSDSAVRVPSALAAVSAPGMLKELQHEGRLHAGCIVSGIDASGAATTSYGASISTSQAFSIQDLIAKPMSMKKAGADTKRSPVFGSSTSATAASKEMERPLLYTVQLQASAQAPMLPRRLQPLPINYSLKQTANTAYAALKADGGNAPALSVVLAVLQQGAVKLPAGAEVGLDTIAALHAVPSLDKSSGSLAASAAWGMTRVAASEVPAVKWGGSDIGVSSVPPYLGSSVTADGLAGGAVHSGIAMEPLLLQANPSSAAAPMAHAYGRVAITGGLGGEFQTHFLSPSVHPFLKF